MRWPDRAVAVRVPATSANLGPGFDALGLALTLYDRVEARVTGGGLTIDVSGEGRDTAGLGEDHLVVRAMRAAFEMSGAQPPGLALRCGNRIPHGRGLGSSAAAIVAGILAARALAPRDTPALEGDTPAPGGGTKALDGDAVLKLASDLEGHPDNVAACLAGGLTVAWPEPDGPRLVRLNPLPEIVPVACVAPAPLATEQTRKVLPEAVSHADAAANAGLAALLVAALTAEPSALLAATGDRLHQPFRFPVMPGTADLVRRLRAGGIPAVVSGAGPSVLAFLVRGTSPGLDVLDSIVTETGTGWLVSPLNVDRHGARVESTPLAAHPETDA